MPDPISWSHALPYLGTVFVVGYLIGSIPSGLILTRMAGLGDIRQIGSGNIGATNVLRTGRKGLAALTLLLDLLKGLAAVWLAARYGPDPAVVAAWGAVIGHIFPIWLRFKGGKGGATMLGVGIGLAPIVALYAALTWLAIAVLLRYSSLATLVAVGLAPVYAWFMGLHQIAEAIALLTVLVWAKHHANIRRLLTGAEPKIGTKGA